MKRMRTGFTRTSNSGYVYSVNRSLLELHMNAGVFTSASELHFESNRLWRIMSLSWCDDVRVAISGRAASVGASMVDDILVSNRRRTVRLCRPRCSSPTDMIWIVSGSLI